MISLTKSYGFFYTRKPITLPMCVGNRSFQLAADIKKKDRGFNVGGGRGGDLTFYL